MKTYALKPCPFCHEYKLKLMKADDGFFMYIACTNRNCAALGPMADYDELISNTENPTSQDIKELAIKKWNQRKYSNYVVSKNVELKSGSHDRMLQM